MRITRLRGAAVAGCLLLSSSVIWASWFSADAEEAVAPVGVAKNDDVPDINAVCTSSTPPNDPLVFSASPGNWANPNRYGTGWSLNYAGPTADRMLSVIWHTYDSAGRATWLISENIQVVRNADGSESWSARLFKPAYDYVQMGTVPINPDTDAVGSVSLSFPAGTATHAAVRWRWNAVSAAQSFDECIYDFWRGAPGGRETAANEVSPAYTANWSEPEGGRGGWGIDVNVGENSQGTRAEQSLFDIFDRPLDGQGQPQRFGSSFWLASEYQASAWPSTSWSTQPLIFNKANYSITADCSSHTCVTQSVLAPSYGGYGRAFTSAFKGVARLVVNTTGLAGAPRVDWPPANWPAAAPADLTGCPAGTVCRPIVRATNGDLILTSMNSCQVQPGMSHCEIDLSWASASASPTAKVYRVDAVTNVSTEIFTGNTGHQTDQLPAGARVSYQLRRGSTRLSGTPIVEAFGSGDAATPVPPTLASVPAEDLVSTAVGYTPGTLTVDQGGQANFTVPIVLPPGRAELTPSLSIGYSSGRGDGIAGWGATLDGLSAISRCRYSIEAGDANPGPIASFAAQSNAYCLDGQRLVLVSGTEGATGAEYRTELESFRKIVIESSEMIHPNGSGDPFYQPTGFKVYSKGGTVSRYGIGSGQRRTAYRPANVYYIAEWWLETVADTTGANTVTYAYNEGSATPNDGSMYLTSVNWVGGRVQLAYTPRPYPNSSFVIEDAALALNRWLQNVQVYGAGGVLLRRYELAYENMPQNATLRRLTAIQECAANNACLEPTVFAWYAHNPSAPVQLVERDGANFRDVQSFKYGDVDGDGRADVIAVDAARGLQISRSIASPSGIDFAPALAVDTIECEQIGTRCASDYGRTWSILDFNADGRDDLLIYKNGGWQIWPSNGTTFDKLNPILVAGSGTSTVNRTPRAVLADFDGDGLPDLITYEMDSISPNVRAWLLTRTGVPATPYTFGTAMTVETQNQNGSVIPGAWCSVANILNHHSEKSDALDINADGRADFAGRMPGSTCSGVALDPESTPDWNAIAQAEPDSVVLDPEAADAIVLFRSLGIVNGKLVFRRAAQLLGVVVDGSPASVQFGDINGDGNYDVLYKASNNVLHYSLNRGNAYFKESLCARPGCQTEGDKDVRLLDYDGDGRLDLWRQNGANNYVVHLWTGGASFDGTETATNFHGGDDTWLKGFADLDGDGYLDNFIARHTEVGAAWKTRRTGEHHKPRNVVSTIGHGLGAINRVHYAPLTSRAVYGHEFTGTTLVSGRGAPVQDVLAPTYAVRALETSAPTAADANATATLRYRYQGLKIQGGGRGSLGFRRMYTLNNGVQTRTEYNQEFPLTGTPRATESRETTWDTTCDSNPEVAGCMVRGGWSETIGRTVNIAENTDAWQYRVGGSVNSPLVRVGPSPIFVYRSRSTAIKRDPAYGLMSAEATDFGPYDAYGNLMASDSRNYADAAMTSEERRVTTANQYLFDNPAVWLLGRLSESVVTTVRPSLAPVVRTSAFSYTADGLIASEELRGGNHPVDTVRKVYKYDSYGNRERVNVCGGTTNLVGACVLFGPASIRFRNTDPNYVVRTTATSFDANGLYPVSTLEVFQRPNTGADVANADQYATNTVTARDAYGTPIAATGINGAVSVAGTDGFGRKYFEATNTGSSSLTTIRWCQNAAHPTGIACPSDGGVGYAAYRLQTTSPGGATAWLYKDRLDRNVLAVREGFRNGDYVAVRTSYDSRGRAARVSEPYFTHSPATASVGQANGASIWYTTTTYDFLDRVTAVAHPNGTTTNIDNRGRTTITTLPPNSENVRETKLQAINVLGEVYSTLDHAGSETYVLFDSTGNATEIRRAVAGAPTLSTTATYDALGRKTSMTDPDAGTWYYQYNALGEEIQKWSAVSCTTSRYDARGRLYERRDYGNGACSGAADTASTWQFDNAATGRGMPSQVTTQEQGQPSYVRTLGYDAFGRGVSTSEDFDGKNYVQRATFDQYGRGFQTFFEGGTVNTPGYIAPTGELFEYNDRGYRSIVRDAYPGYAGQIYYQVFLLDARGNVVEEQRADNPSLSVQRQYEPSTGRVKQIWAGGGAIQNLSYDYDPIGNLTVRHDRSGVDLYERFRYDSLQRLTTGERREANGTFTLTSWHSYDALGNLTNGATYDRQKKTLCASVNEVAPGPGAITSIGTNQFCYDAIGNMVRTMDSTNNPVEKRKIVYSPFQQARQISTNNAFSLSTSAFVYGPERQRLRQNEYANTTGTGVPRKSIVYVGGAEIVTLNGNTQQRELRRYVTGMVVTRQIRTGGVVLSTKHQYLFTDAQGSTHRITSGEGYVLNNGGQQAWTPFGTRATPSTGVQLPGATRFGFDTSITARGYTGHEQIDRNGVIHMGGRIYDPVLGRFLQADPFVQAPTNLQNLNRYSYVNNNPLTHTDPSGYWGKQQQGYLRTAVAIVISVYTGGAAMGQWGFLGMSASTAAANAGLVTMAGGFASGAVATGNLRGAVTGAFTAAIGLGTGQLIDKGLYGQAFVVGAASGGVLEGMNGGSFGHGFAKAGLSVMLSPALEKMSGSGQAVAQVIAGGVVERVGGGKFANGAATAAFSMMMRKMFSRKNIGGGGGEDVAEAQEGAAYAMAVRDFQPDESGYHFYANSTYMCDVTQQFNCNVDVVFNQGLRMQPTPERRNSPVGNGEITQISGFGPVKTTVNASIRTVWNETMAGHILYPGLVTRSVVQAGSQIFIHTTSAGTGMGWANGPQELVGPPFWTAVDMRIRERLPIWPRTGGPAL